MVKKYGAVIAAIIVLVNQGIQVVYCMELDKPSRKVKEATTRDFYNDGLFTLIPEDLKRNIQEYYRALDFLPDDGLFISNNYDCPWRLSATNPHGSDMESLKDKGYIIRKGDELGSVSGEMLLYSPISNEKLNLSDEEYEQIPLMIGRLRKDNWKPFSNDLLFKCGYLGIFNSEEETRICVLVSMELRRYVILVGRKMDSKAGRKLMGKSHPSLM